MKNVFKLAAALSIGLTAVSGAANAGVYNVTLKHASGNASGTYHVTLTTFADGSVRLTNGQANTGPSTPNNQIMNVRVQFFKTAVLNFSLSNIVAPAAMAAGTVAQTTPGGVYTNNVTAQFAEFTSPKLSPKNIQQNASNVFSTSHVGAFGEVRASTGSGYKGILVRFNSQQPITGNFGGAYDAFIVVPEASSVALMLPALLPLGIALRRRSKTRK